MRALVLVAVLTTGCAVARIPTPDGAVYAACLGQSAVEVQRRDDVVRVEGGTFSSGFAGILEAAVTAAVAYFGLGM